MTEPDGGQPVGGRDVIRFNGKEYHFDLMNVSRLARLLDAITGTTAELAQVGIVSEARRRLRRRIEAEGLSKAPPPVDPTKTKAQQQAKRHHEYAAMRDLKDKWAPYVGVQLAGGVMNRPGLAAAFRTADQKLQQAVRTKTCLENRAELEKLFDTITVTYQAERIAAANLRSATSKRTVTTSDAIIHIRDHLDTKGLEGKKALQQELKGLDSEHQRLQRRDVRILDLRDGFDNLTEALNDLAERAVNLRLPGQKADGKDLSRYYNSHDAHNQVITNASPRILVPESNSAAITKGRNVIAAVQAGDQLIVAAKNHANSVSPIVTATRSQYHIRLSQGSTQIRLEAIETTQSVSHPTDATAPKKSLKFIDFKQIQFGH
ncbi:hypothetical protein [Occultella gossypii]|uniref:Uncharacterized protein n=1 Tax=Occultella gossypii TaxID=2800820 RepID=A0ABS7S5W8_9MICO|nr:hypothetical protein [Occultella gossypii]MBZ2195477.1 hypothetical protein [Occultella gossypii]